MGFPYLESIPLGACLSRTNSHGALATRPTRRTCLDNSVFVPFLFPSLRGLLIFNDQKEVPLIPAAGDLGAAV